MITCHQCGRTSYHPKDEQFRYCGWCHQYHDDMKCEHDNHPESCFLCMNLQQATFKQGLMTILGNEKKCDDVISFILRELVLDEYTNPIKSPNPKLYE